MKTLSELLKMYDQFHGTGDIRNFRKYLGLPDCDYCTRLAHSLWANVLSAKSMTDGRLQTLANLEVQYFNNKLDALTKIDLVSIDQQLKALDKVFNTTH